MKYSSETAVSPAELRRRAENTLRAKAKDLNGPLTEADARKLLHELQVHQIELEMQNAELIQARDEQFAALERYTDLYEFAPVGYLTIDRKGTVHSANLTCATLLGVERSRLTGRWFQMLLDDAARPVFNAFLEKVFEEKERATCELSFQRKGLDPIDIRLEAAICVASQDCRVAIIDITQRKLAEAQKKESIQQIAGGVAHEFASQIAEIAQACKTLLSRTLPQNIDAPKKGVPHGKKAANHKRPEKQAKHNSR